MRLTKKKAEAIIDVVFDYADFDVEVCGYRDYDVIPSIQGKGIDKVREIIEEILNEVDKGRPHRWRDFIRKA